MQGTWVRALVREDPTRHRATKPMLHNYWACALEPTSHNYWAHAPQLLKPMCSRACMLQLLKPVCLEPMLWNKRSPRTPQLEKAHMQQRRPSTAKKKKIEWSRNNGVQLWTLGHRKILWLSPAMLRAALWRNQGTEAPSQQTYERV